MQKRGLLVIVLLIVPVLLASFVFAASCSDSDGGANYAVKGTVTAKVPYIGVLSALTRTVRYTDSCLLTAIKGNMLIEYSCKGDSVVKQIITCPKCMDGVCPSTTTAATADYSKLTVTIKDEKGNAFGSVRTVTGIVNLGAGRKITLYLRSDPINVKYSKTTDSNSTVKFTNISPGEYFLFVSAPIGYKAWTGGNICPFTLIANESKTLDIYIWSQEQEPLLATG